MIPQDEVKHYNAAVVEQAQGDVDAPPPETSAEDIEFFDVMRREAQAIKHHAPTVWAALCDRTVPRPGSVAMISIPDASMSFGEHAAYRMGQHSIVEWIETVAHWTIGGNDQ